MSGILSVKKRGGVGGGGGGIDKFHLQEFK